MLQTLGQPPVTQAELRHTAQQIDRDGSGQIEFDEFRDLLHRWRKGLPALKEWGTPRWVVQRNEQGGLAGWHPVWQVDTGAIEERLSVLQNELLQEQVVVLREARAQLAEEDFHCRKANFLRWLMKRRLHSRQAVVL